MPNSKTYLNVPYAQKDAAKALGARWDAARKKWYISAVMDVTLFAKWQPKSFTADSHSSSAMSSSVSNATTGVITHAKDKNFVAYNGDEPPWD
jgi:Domain of unknown function (DUF5710)